MANVQEHYENHLSEVYSWLFGGLAENCKKNQLFFQEQEIIPKHSGIAIDLGAGSGFQSIPLAQAGFKVTAIDLSQKLLTELQSNKQQLSIETKQADICEFTERYQGPSPELVVLMGDTLTHLPSKEKLEALFSNVYKLLKDQGKFVLSFRDLSNSLTDLARFIPVRSDKNTIFTCFLEYEPNHVKVHDLIYSRTNQESWELQKSFYLKLRISKEWLTEKLLNCNFKLDWTKTERGFVSLIFLK